MKTIALVAQKGGVGKSTLCLNLAVTAVKSGHSCLILNTDPQGSVADWIEIRQAEAPEVVSLSAQELPDALKKLRASSTPPDLVFIDTAPHAGPDSVDIVRAVDLCLIPVMPGFFEISATIRTLETLAMHKKTKGLVVLNRCPASAPEIDQAREAFESAGVKVAATQIADRRPFWRSIISGRSVAEFQPKGKAAEEIKQLLEEVLK